MSSISPFTDAFYKMMHMDYKARHLLYNRLGAGHAFPPVLDYLVEHDGCSQREIGQFLHREPATVTTTIDNMVRAGLVERAMDKKDRRRVKLHVTAKGREKQAELRTTALHLEDCRMAGFSAEEKQLFLQFCERISFNLNDCLQDSLTEE